jgi:hypothetical protein
MACPSHSTTLWRKIRLAEGRLDASARAFWTHPRLGAFFPEFLFALYSSMRSTVPLMEEARDRAQHMASGDPVAALTAEYLTQHIEEELHHDEWLLEDMVAMGIDGSAVLSRIPPGSIASLVGAQYYWIYHVHPVALFGYLAVLEGNPPSVQQLSVIQARHELPSAAFRTLIEHAEMDLEHLEGLNQTIDRMPLEERHSSLLALSAFQTIDNLSCVFEELLVQNQNVDSSHRGLTQSPSAA